MIDDGAVALVGTYQSDVTQNVASVAERGRVPLVIDVAVDDKILDQGYKYTFRVQPNATSMGTSGAESLAKIGKDAGDPITRVAYLHIEGAFGDSVFNAFKAEASKQGITDIKEITYPPTNFSDATTQVREAAAYKPDVIVATGYFPDGVLIAKSVNELKPDIKGLYGIANGAFDDGSFPSAAGPAAQGVLSANYHYDAKSSKVQDIRKRFEQKYGKPMETASVLSYQAVEVVAAGLEKAKNADPEKVREGISGVKIDEPLLAFDGPITFDKTGPERERHRDRDAEPEEQDPAGLSRSSSRRPRSSSPPARRSDPGTSRRTVTAGPLHRGSWRDGRRPGRAPAGRCLLPGRQGPRAGDAGRGDRTPARRCLRPRLDRADADLRGARHRQLRPGGDAHAGDVPRLRARPPAWAYRCTSPPCSRCRSCSCSAWRCSTFC